MANRFFIFVCRKSLPRVHVSWNMVLTLFFWNMVLTSTLVGRQLTLYPDPKHFNRYSRTCVRISRGDSINWAKHSLVLNQLLSPFLSACSMFDGQWEGHRYLSDLCSSSLNSWFDQKTNERILLEILKQNSGVGVEGQNTQGEERKTKIVLILSSRPLKGRDNECGHFIISSDAWTLFFMKLFLLKQGTRSQLALYPALREKWTLWYPGGTRFNWAFQ